MEVEISEICRACLTHQEGMLSLYDIYEHDLTLAAILKSCINAELYEGDGFPSRLCDNCTLILTQFYNFAAVYEESDRQLKAVLQKNDDIKVEIGESEGSNHEYSTLPRQKLTKTSNYYNTQNDFTLYETEETSNEERNVDGENFTEVFRYEEGDEGSQIKLEAVEVSFSAGEEYDHNDSQFSEETYSDKVVSEKPSHYECISCSEIFLYESYYLEHMETYHNADSNSADNVKDQFTESNEQNNVSDSLLLDPTIREITKYECETCGEAYLYQSSFQSHMRIKHKLEDIICENYCTKSYVKVEPKPERHYPSSQDYLQDLPDRPFACNHCPRRFRQAYMLEQHKELHSGKKKFVCDVCGKGFVRKTYLDDHMEGHSTVKKYVCKFCGKAFQRRTVLRAHKRTHTHPNFYVCDQCGRGFTSTSTLKTHKKLIHIRERNFKCVICLQSFPLKSTLAKHIRRHINKNKAEKDFPCSMCEMQYRDKSSLKRHVEIKHLGKAVVVSCPDCPKQYTSKANLIKHRRRHHMDG